MSLVAYDDSSDDDLDEDEAANVTVGASSAQQPAKPVSSNGFVYECISDDDDNYAPMEPEPFSNTENKPIYFLLPEPRHETAKEELSVQIAPIFAQLPIPKATTIDNVLIEEKDDEFLLKKADIPIEVQEKPPAPNTSKGPVKISIPSLKEFSDVDEELASKVVKKSLVANAEKKSGLLSILPTAKTEANFIKARSPIPIANDGCTKKKVPLAIPIKENPFIPDTVKNRRPAYNTEGVDGMKSALKRPGKPTTETSKDAVADCSDNEDTDEESNVGMDFFSLNTKDQLPEVSANEINIMVAQRAAKMASTGAKYGKAAKPEEPKVEKLQPNEVKKQNQLDQEAVNALVGSSAKRRRKAKNIRVLDISSEQVLPNRDEWMRTALASSTEYQPRGVLTDEEPAAGTRRKHQITYLAHKAKANEAELQAMWASNRQNRRAAQSKYGF